MRAVVQRVHSAQVTVEGAVVGAIGPGLLIFLGVGPADDPAAAEHLAQRLARLRIFADPQGRFNRSLLEVGGAACVVSQFTLFADARRGHRPSFHGAAPAPMAEALCATLVAALRRLGVAEVATGRFGARMTVAAEGDGPVTIVISTADDGWATDCG